MKLKAEFFKYKRDDNDRVVRKEAELIPLPTLNSTLHAGCLFYIRELTYIPTQNRYCDEVFVLSRVLGSETLSWMDYSGYHTGSPTILDFVCDIEGHQISPEKFRQDLSNFYRQIEGSQFKLDNAFLIDGWLEVSLK